MPRRTSAVPCNVPILRQHLPRATCSTFSLISFPATRHSKAARRVAITETPHTKLRLLHKWVHMAPFKAVYHMLTCNPPSTSWSLRTCNPAPHTCPFNRFRHRCNHLMRLLADTVAIHHK